MERGSANTRLASALWKHVTIKALVKAEALMKPPVRLDSIGRITRLAKDLGERRRVVGQTIVREMNTVAAWPE